MSVRKSMETASLADRVVPYLQPITDPRCGNVVGFEALARLQDGKRLLSPAQFLNGLSGEQPLELFAAMLTKSFRFTQNRGMRSQGRFVSVNVSASVLLQPHVLDVVRFVIADRGGGPVPLVFEILESEAIVDLGHMASVIGDIKALGIAVALDDIGSAYASLQHIKDLPVDMLKLDQCFTRRLAERPEDLQFISSMLGLARALGRRLVVEGVESADVLDALTIIGVENVQGYAIAPPMPAGEAARWLSAWKPTVRSREPRTMLGVYAAHLSIVEACCVLARQPLRLSWHPEALDPHRCAIGKFFDRMGLHDTTFGLAHKRFHHALGANGTRSDWRSAAEDLRLGLLDAIADDVGAQKAKRADGTEKAASLTRQA